MCEEIFNNKIYLNVFVVKKKLPITILIIKMAMLPGSEILAHLSMTPVGLFYIIVFVLVTSLAKSIKYGSP